MRDHVREQETALQKERDEIEDRKKAILAQAREEKKELLEEALDEVDEILKDLRKSIREKNQHDAEEKVQAIRRNLRAGLQDLEADSEKNRLKAPVPGQIPDEVRTGGLYYAPALNVTGTVMKGPDSRGNCVLQSGSMRFTVAKDTLRYPSDEQVSQKPADKSSRSQARAGTIKTVKSGAADIRLSRAQTTMPEIQLLGMTVDEAITALDRYIDDCVLSNIGTIRIVHGKGTGALRSAVTMHLKSDKRISSFRLGAYGEGEDGVTIAQL